MEMKCRYDSEHGPFSSPGQLTRHYTNEHGDVFVAVVKPTRDCAHCGKVLKPSSIGNHMRTKHGITPPFSIHLRPINGEALVIEPTKTTMTDSDRAAIPITCDVCGKRMRRGSAAKHFQRMHGGRSWSTNITVVGAEREAGELALLDHHADDELDAVAEHVDDVEQWNVLGIDAESIVASTFELLAQPHGVVPIAAIPAMLVWHNATQAMLRDVTQRSR